MRILFFSSIFPRPWAPNRGIYCFHLCKAFRDLGHQVKVISPSSWLERHSQPAHADALPELQTLDVEYPRYFYPPGFLRSAYGAFMWAGVKRTVRRAVADAAPDLVISYWAHPDGAVAGRIARDARAPSAVIVGGSDVLVLPRESQFRRRRIVAALESSDAVLAVSESLSAAVISLGIAPEKVHVEYQGIDTAHFHPGNSTEERKTLGIEPDIPMLLFVGNLVPVKAVDTLLDACALLSRSVSFQLYVLGDGPCRRSLREQARRLGLSERVRFHGPVPQRDLPSWYRAADLTVLSSLSEGIPNVLRESLACGTPFVATDVGGIREITANPWNRLVPSQNPSALFDAIRASLKSPKPTPESLAVTVSWRQSAEQMLNTLSRFIRTTSHSSEHRVRCATR